MKAMVLEALADLRTEPAPLKMARRPEPDPGPGELLLKVSVCGVCHTELDIIEGRTAPPRLPLIPGHQVIATVEKASESTTFQVGQRVGVAWIFSACGNCEFCTTGRENLCAEFRATGRDVDGGYAEYMKVGAGYAYGIPEQLSDLEAAPLMCAGSIGYRSLRLAELEERQILGLAGFGGSGHLTLQLAKAMHPSLAVFVFTRSAAQREFARSLGADWAGGFDETPPARMHAIIDTTPAWDPIVRSLTHLKPGGRLVVNAIRKEGRDQDSLLQLDYASQLWMEKEIRSVANVTRRDVRECLQLAASAGIRAEVQEYPLEAANSALLELKQGGSRGSKVLRVH